MKRLHGLKGHFYQLSKYWVIALLPRKVWFSYWTPVWHEGRGPYLSVGLWVIAVYRGY